MDNSLYVRQFQRNIGILTEEEQEMIRKTRIAVLGCGGGSDVARQLAASGFEQLLLADNDTVEQHNLNRQFYFQEHVGVNKATALAKNLKKINSNIQLEIITDMVTIDSIPDIVRRYDILIDAIPPETALREELVLAREVRKYGKKHHVYFIDIPWGAKMIVFGKGTQSFEEFMGMPKDCDLSYVGKMTLEDLTRNYMIDASDEMRRVGKMMYEGKLNYFPQMAVTVSLAASMIATMCIFLSIGKKVKLAPHVFNIDYFKEFISS